MKKLVFIVLVMFSVGRVNTVGETTRTYTHEARAGSRITDILWAPLDLLGLVMLIGIDASEETIKDAVYAFSATGVIAVTKFIATVQGRAFLYALWSGALTVPQALYVAGSVFPGSYAAALIFVAIAGALSDIFSDKPTLLTPLGIMVLHSLWTLVKPFSHAFVVCKFITDMSTSAYGIMREQLSKVKKLFSPVPQEVVVAEQGVIQEAEREEINQSVKKALSKVGADLTPKERKEAEVLIKELNKELPEQSAPIKQDLYYTRMQGLLGLIGGDLALKDPGQTVAALNKVEEEIKQLQEASDMYGAVLESYGAYKLGGYGVEKLGGYGVEETGVTEYLALLFVSHNNTSFKVLVPLQNLKSKIQLQFYARDIINNWPQQDDARAYELKFLRIGLQEKIVKKVDGKAVSSF